MNQLRACALFLLCVSHLVFGQQPENQVRAQLLSPVEAVVPGSTVWFGLALTIAPGWNTYWSNPGVTGLPPSVTFGEGDNSITPELFFPVAATKAFGGDDTLLTYGYSDQVIHPFAMTVPASTAGSYVLEGEARWLVCRELCIPESQPVRLALPVVTAAQTPALHPDAARIDTARGAVPADFPGAFTVSADRLQIWLSGFQDVTVLDLMPEATGLVAGRIVTQTPTDQGRWLSLDRPLPIDDGVLDQPLVVVSAQGGSRLHFDATLASPEFPSGAALALPLALLMALVGGLLLNLMPCVFPVLSIKALAIAKKAQAAPAEVAASVGLYGLGIWVSMLLLAGLMVALQIAGHSIGWGFQLQSAWFVGLLVFVFVLLGYNLLGWFEFGGQAADLGQSLTEGGSYRSAFFTGVLAVVVATPCTAPFMGVAMGYTLTQPWWITLLVFSALGLGLAAPMLALVVFPGISQRLPRPGAWMVTLKQTLAFPVFATAIWLIWVMTRQTSADAMALLLAGLLWTSFGLWLRQAWSKRPLVGVAIALSGMLVIPLIATSASVDDTTASSQRAASVESVPYSEADLATALAAGQTVFLNMTADWCITCKVTEQRLLHTERVSALFAEHQVLRMTGDWTRYDASITAYLNRFHRVGVPLYVIESPAHPPRVLSQFPSFDELAEAVASQP